MSAIADIFAAVRLNLETGSFEVDAAKVAGTAGDAMGKKLSDTLKASARTALGAAAGAGFAMALSGANQLDAATKRLVADAGLTSKAADDAGHSLAGMYGNNLQGFDAIGAAMAKVHNDLGLTGAAADAATEKFLKFSTATGQDAAGAVTSFDDILDAWNLTAADAGSVMDKLVVSHQEFGGVIAESESALSAMAPAMQAANMSINDGIALLNLFNAAGIDAAKAPAALAKAVKALKPGQDLDDLIAQLGAIEDPTLRGQKAMEIFGARSGIGLAQAIKPGMTSLADLTARLGNTAGATDRAAEASLTWGDKWTLVLHKVGGALADFGTQFGPLLMVAAAFGPKMLAAIGAGLGGAGALLIPKITGPLTSNVAPWMTTGTKIGTIIGTAIGPAMALAAAAAVVMVWDSINKELNSQAAANSGRLGEVISTQTMAQLEQDKAAIGKGIADIMSIPFGETLYGDQLASLRADLAKVDAAIAKSKEALWRDSRAPGAAVAAVAGPSTIDPAKLYADAARIASQVGAIIGANVRIPAALVAQWFGTSTIDEVAAAAKRTGALGMVALAQGISDARQAPVDAFNTMLEMLKTPETKSQEEMRLAGGLTSKALADGLRSQDPEIKAQAVAVRRMLVARLEELALSTHALGASAMDELNAGLASKDSTIRRTAELARDAVLAALEADAKARTIGADIGSSYVEGLGSTWLPGRNAGVGPIKLASGMPYVEQTMPAIIHAGEAVLTVAQADAWRAGGGGPREQKITIEHVEIRDAHDEFSLIQQLRFLASVG